MRSVYEGVFDVYDASFTVMAKELVEICNLVEAILPSATFEFLIICHEAKHLFIAQQNNRVTTCRDELTQLVSNLTQVRGTYDTLSPFSKMHILPEFDHMISTLIASVESALSSAFQLPNGKQPKTYRYELAVKIARLMKEHGKVPKANTPKLPELAKNSAYDYHNLMKQGIRLVDGVVTNSTRDYLRHGVAHS